jgi:hypothetical protein
MADVPVTPLSEKDAPKTFAERGASVPFTTAALMWARVRQQAHIKELLVPGLANTRGIYVFEWAGVPQRFTLTLHDRLLHRAIAPEPAPTPTTIAAIANRVALSGAAGPDVQAAAQRRVAQAETLTLLARYTLMMRAIERMSGDGTRIAVAELRTAAGQQRAKDILAKIAVRSKLTPQVLQERIDQLGTNLADTGLPGMPIKAPVRLLMQNMAQMSRVLREWADEGKGDSIVEARLISQVAEETFRLAEQLTAIVDDSTVDIDTLLADWTNGERVVRAATQRLSWVLDGWERLVNMWLDVADRSPSDQSQTLSLMSYLLPLMPPSELKPEDSAKWGQFSTTLYAQARNSETPPTGNFDLEMMLRLEGHRAREAS